MKQLKITPPEGYEIDKEKSTFDCIVFKESVSELPTTWEELGKVKGWYNTYDCETLSADVKTSQDNRNVFLTKSQAKAAIALAQLTHLRDKYRQGWRPNWENREQEKYVIYCVRGGFQHLKMTFTYNPAQFLTFQSADVMERFITNFTDLIIEAAPLLYGEEL